MGRLVIKSGVLSDAVSILLMVWLGLILLRQPLGGLTGLEVFGMLDELLALAVLAAGTVYMVFWNRISWVFLMILGLLAYLIGISLLFGRNREVMEIVLQSVIHLKFFLILWALMAMNRRSYAWFDRFLKVMIGVAVAGFLLELALGDTFNHAFNMEVATRNNVRRISGFFHPNQLSVVFLLWFYRWFNRHGEEAQAWKTGIYLVLTAGVITLIGSRTTLLGLALLLLGYFGPRIWSDARILLGLVVFGTLAVVVLAFGTDFIGKTVDNLANGFDLEGPYIRGIMLHLSVLLAIAYFPIGSGAGTFGSLYSEGSAVYRDLGVHQRYYFQEMFGVYDSNLATVLGEFGLVGLVFFGFLLWCFYTVCYHRTPQGGNNRLMVTLIFIYIALNALVNPVFTNSMFSVILAIFIINFIEPPSHADT